MNGCCMAHADCRCHDATCDWYWPCGCRKQRTAGGRAKSHLHRYGEAKRPDTGFYTIGQSEDEEDE